MRSVSRNRTSSGYGVLGNVDAEILFAKVFGLQAELGGIWLPHTNPPTDPTIAPHGDGMFFSAMLGVRLHPFGRTQVAGPWIDFNGGYVRTGSTDRPGFDAHVGYDFRLGSRTRWDIGPFLGYTDVVQPSDALRPEDAHILSLGVQFSFGAPTPAPPRPDTDRDGVFDDEDACAAVPGCAHDRSANERLPPRSRS